MYVLEIFKEDSEELKDVKEMFAFLEDELVGSQTNTTEGDGKPRPIRIVRDADERDKNRAT